MLGKRSWVLYLFVVAVIFDTAGCSRGPVIPKTVAVRGKVVYKDQPLADAEIGFVGKLDNKDVLAARGMTNAVGEFTLSTYIDPQHEVSGSTPGDYAVTVTKMEKKDMAQIMQEFKDNPAMTFEQLVPEKYTDAKATPLTATVSLDGENVFDFKLED